jgi:hypothetical protein
MADTFLTIDSNGGVKRATPLDVSEGAVNAGRLVMTDGHGKLDSSFLPNDSVETFRDVIASEPITANHFVNIFWDSTSSAWRARNADASSLAGAAVGYVVELVQSADDTARVFFSGELQIDGVDSAVTELHLTDTPGVADVFDLTTATSGGWKLCQLVARRTGSNTFAFVQSEAVRL